MTQSYAREHLAETARIAAELDPGVLDRMAALLGELRERGGRLFFLRHKVRARDKRRSAKVISAVSPVRRA